MSNGRLFSLNDVRKFLEERLAQNAQAASSQANSEEALEQPIVGYRMLEKMGSGGTGVVFKAENMATGDIVALKLLYPHTSPQVLEQFINEGMMLIRLDHPNILKGFDFGFSNSFYFLTLEYILGESLVTFLEKGFQFTEEFTFRIALQIARALAYLEKRKIVHRDVKPSNILLVEDMAKLCDFALSIDRTKQENVEEMEETTCGTVEYISPEQAQGRTDIDSRSDVYSLGITCIHMLSGRLPFQDETPLEIMRRQVHEPIDLSCYELSSTTTLLLSLMVAKDRKKRLLAGKLVSLLEKFLRNPSGPL